ncbi:MAG: 16S rRNA (cytidine(1402)-2'-O)-methyltransferase [Bacteroidia bacterium]
MIKSELGIQQSSYFCSISETKLYIVGTPIGNMGDITYRAIDTFKKCDAILAEDTRQSKKILDHYGIEKKLIPYHQHNEHRNLGSIVEQLKNGAVYAMCSDAGMPGISDPGFLLIRECHRENISVEIIPGPTAAITALVGSALPSDRFVFEGFLPHKKGKQSKILSFKDEERTVICYESPHRLLKSLAMIKDLLGEDRLVSVGRELTKKFEEHKTGTVVELIEYFETGNVKGEIVLLIAGCNYAKED